MSNSTIDRIEFSSAPSDVPKTTIAGMSDDATTSVMAALQDRLVATLDLQLTLKHVHWNVVGMNFIAVHEMLDPQVDAVREMTDQVAERIATMGGEPKGTPGAVTRIRSWDDYPLNRAPTVQHLVELDKVYDGVASDHRRVIARLGELDPVSEDLFIGHIGGIDAYAPVAWERRHAGEHAPAAVDEHLVVAAPECEARAGDVLVPVAVDIRRDRRGGAGGHGGQAGGRPGGQTCCQSSCPWAGNYFPGSG